MLRHVLLWYEHRLNGIVEARVRSFYGDAAVAERSAYLLEADLVTAASGRVWDETDAMTAALAWLDDPARVEPVPVAPVPRDPATDALELLSYIHAVSDEYGDAYADPWVEARVARYAGDLYIDEHLPVTLDATLMASAKGAWTEADVAAVAIPAAQVLEDAKLAAAVKVKNARSDAAVMAVAG